MSINSSFNKRNLLYYLFAAFLLIIFVRWGMLVHQKNINAYNDKLALYDLIIDIDTSETTLELYNQEVVRIEEQYKRQRLRIATEGAIFFLLLLFGIVRMFIYFRKEIELALQQSNFLLSITHELKSPLASAILNIQTILKRKTLNAEQKEKLLQNSDEELVRLRALVERLLLAAKMEGEEMVYEKETLNISNLYKKLYQNYEVQFKHQFKMFADIQSNLKINGDRVLISSVFTNLMDNAIKYCSNDGAIKLLVTEKHGNVEVYLENEGEIIPQKEKRKIWNKFYRIGDENTRSSKGTGLGLYIVNEIVEGHDGGVDILDADNGIVFKVFFPIVNE